MPLGETMQRVAERIVHLRSVFDDSLLAERLDRRDADSARERMPAVSKPACEELVAYPRGERLPDRHRSERHVAGVDALRHRDDVGYDVPVVDGEPLARA